MALLDDYLCGWHIMHHHQVELVYKCNKRVPILHISNLR